MMINTSVTRTNTRKATTRLIILMFVLFPSAIFASPYQGRQSIYFVANEGQWDAPFSFKANIGSAIYYVTQSGMTIDFRQYERQASARSRNPMDEFMDRHELEPVSVRGHVLKMNFVNGNATPEIVGEEMLASYSNYFLGRDSCNWRGHVGHYQKVILREVWPGIDVELVVQPEGVETVYHVAPFVDPSQIQIQYEGLDAPLTVDANGSLLLQTSLGIVKERAPWAWQKDGPVQTKRVRVCFQAFSSSAYSLQVQEYDRQKELIVDPLLYGSYWGGTGPDFISDMAVRANGDIVVCGNTRSDDFPTTPGAYQEVFGAPGGLNGGFVSRLNPDAETLIFSTYLASETEETGLNKVVLDNADQIYVAGWTYDQQWPTTPAAIQPEFAGGSHDAIFCRFSADGAILEYSTYLGSSGSDGIGDIVPDANGLLYICGQVWLSPAFSISEDAVFPNSGGGYDGFLLAFDPGTSSLNYATFIPGQGTDASGHLRLVSPGILWVSGYTTSTDFPVTENAFQSNFQSDVDWQPDGYLMLLDLNQNSLLYSSYFGGEDFDVITVPVVPIGENRVLVCGFTTSENYPITPNALDSTRDPYYMNGFAAVISLEGGLLHSTYLSGDSDGDDDVRAATVGPRGITIIGGTASFDFPITQGADDTLFNDNGSPAPEFGDAFVVRVDTALSALLYGTFLGGAAAEFAESGRFENADTVWVVGETGSNDFPVTPNALQGQGGPLGDGFLARICLPPTTQAWRGRSVAVVSNMIGVYPNPFNPITTLSFGVATTSTIIFELYNIQGQSTLRISFGQLTPGYYSRTIDMAGYPTGMYWGRLLSGGNYSKVISLTLVR